uniref:Secreted protein n=2 Tax=Physcomitrium patens TaxID=3218 RepID=A0A2K1IC65_PHYPA|nr:hypothetical protein PHYPA_030356 [Physcomitrium patens]
MTIFLLLLRFLTVFKLFLDPVTCRVSPKSRYMYLFLSKESCSSVRATSSTSSLLLLSEFSHVCCDFRQSLQIRRGVPLSLGSCSNPEQSTLPYHTHSRYA